jgi:hypothetical protein
MHLTGKVLRNDTDTHHCCSGAASDIFQLTRLSDTMRAIYTNDVKAFAISLVYYNNQLALGATVVDTCDDPEDDWKHINHFCDSAVVLHGCTYNFLPDTTRSKNEILYFTYFTADVGNPGQNVRELVKEHVKSIIGAELLKTNPWVKDCEFVGQYVIDSLDRNDVDLICTEVNARTIAFDVGAISVDADNIHERRNVVYKLKNGGPYMDTSSMHPTMEVNKTIIYIYLYVYLCIYIYTRIHMNNNTFIYLFFHNYFFLLLFI